MLSLRDASAFSSHRLSRRAWLRSAAASVGVLGVPILPAHASPSEVVVQSLPIELLASISLREYLSDLGGDELSPDAKRILDDVERRRRGADEQADSERAARTLLKKQPAALADTVPLPPHAPPLSAPPPPALALPSPPSMPQLAPPPVTPPSTPPSPKPSPPTFFGLSPDAFTNLSWPAPPATPEASPPTLASPGPATAKGLTLFGLSPDSFRIVPPPLAAPAVPGIPSRAGSGAEGVGTFFGVRPDAFAVKPAAPPVPAPTPVPATTAPPPTPAPAAIMAPVDTRREGESYFDAARRAQFKAIGGLFGGPSVAGDVNCT